MDTFVVRVWLPDRPGALGQVASRIGAVHGDVIGIDILERGGGSAIDELTVSLPDAGLVDLLVAEIRQVDGVAVEDVRPLPAGRTDGSLAALTTAAAIVAAAPAERLQVACDSCATLLDADWVLALCMDGPTTVAHTGVLPDLQWLAAFLLGSEHLGEESEHTPGDMLWCRLPLRGVAFACGRAGRVFHARERDEFRLLGGIAECLG